MTAKPHAWQRQLLAKLPELIEIERMARHLPLGMGRVSTLVEIPYQDQMLPIHCFDFGGGKEDAPTFLLAAGVHGLERIGTRVVLSYLKTLVNMYQWDEVTRHMLSRVRLVVVPLINPVGMLLNRRSNGNGVDLMRNSPTEALLGEKLNIASGHRISSKLPWYRGRIGDPMEHESQAIVDLVLKEICAKSSTVIALDVHSGFGSIDRLWFPYAKTRQPFPELADVYSLSKLLDHAYPNHIYCIEPQSSSYTTHGDLWDHIYDRNLELNKNCRLLPLTLELGSWLWVKKNPRQLFSAMGIFNPLIPHRQQRILRRHLNLLDFLLRAAAAGDRWVVTNLEKRQEYSKLASLRWYRGAA
jgi:predicted deacylase